MFLGLFTAFPDIPPMPGIIVSGWSWFLGASDAGFGLLIYLVSQPLYVALVALVLFMTTFEYVYHFVIRFLIFRLFMGFVGR